MNYQTENMCVNFSPEITINILFLTYSAEDNSCQNFMLSFLESNGLANPRNVLFTKQPTMRIGLLSPELRKLTNTVTDIDTIREGGI